MVMKVLIEPGSSKSVIATIAIGSEYYDAWKANALPGWEKYCSRNGLGLIAFDDDLVPSSDKHWKKPTWQKMLIGETLRGSSLDVENVCYLDTDILVNQTAPNVFDSYDPETIGLVSLRRNLPYPYDRVLRRLAFLRHTYYDESYPLDSALFMSLEQLYAYHNLPVQADEACMGLIVFNVSNHSSVMRSWFNKYDRTVQSVSNGGDQTHVNYEVQNWGRVTWLDYRYQAIWAFEMAWKYPFLYRTGRDDPELIRECIEASLNANYFLHFAGSWHESEMWKIGAFFEGAKQIELENYQRYLGTAVTGEPKGYIKPQ
jgi:hypothetical protein